MSIVPIARGANPCLFILGGRVTEKFNIVTFIFWLLSLTSFWNLGTLFQKLLCSFSSLFTTMGGGKRVLKYFDRSTRSNNVIHWEDIFTGQNVKIIDIFDLQTGFHVFNVKLEKYFNRKIKGKKAQKTECKDRIQMKWGAGGWGWGGPLLLILERDHFFRKKPVRRWYLKLEFYVDKTLLQNSLSIEGFSPTLTIWSKLNIKKLSSSS